MKNMHIIGGGTFSHVRNHLALAAPAFGTTARVLNDLIRRKSLELDGSIRGLVSGSSTAIFNSAIGMFVHLHLTKMADPSSTLVTNQDVSDLLDKLIADPSTRVIILNAALCDYDGSVLEKTYGVDDREYETLSKSGSREQRLKTSDGMQQLVLSPTEKLIGKIRRERKDIFVVGFKTTTGASSDEQYATALNMLKRDSLNLVLANDTVTRNNMIVAPEETRYCETIDRDVVLKFLVDMVVARSTNTFTRSTVKHGDSIPWDSPQIPDNLRQVVNYCIEAGAYKPFRGKTAGHFAVRIDDKTILTSKRKVNFNQLAEVGLVRVEYEGDDKVIAFGAKPSVGGQSQRAVFRDHPGLDCIVHFHAPFRENYTDLVPKVPQWQNECGSHQCGQNTSYGLSLWNKNLPQNMKAVMLIGHGPNIVFSRDTPASQVISFIERNFDLSQKTGGLIKEELVA